MGNPYSFLRLYEPTWLQVLRTYRRAARERRKAESERQQGFTAANMAQCAKMPQDRLETGNDRPKMVPRQAQERQQQAKTDPRLGQDRPKTGQDSPKTGQDRPKTGC